MASLVQVQVSKTITEERKTKIEGEKQELSYGHRF